MATVRKGEPCLAGMGVLVFRVVGGKEGAGVGGASVHVEKARWQLSEALRDGVLGQWRQGRTQGVHG